MAAEGLSESRGAGARKRQLAVALRLEQLTLGWNVVEGRIALLTALAAGSVALLGFGADSLDGR